MGRLYDGIDEGLGAWIVAQPVFFVATAPLSGSGLVNCSPKGNRGELAVLDRATLAYLDQTGSGVETIAHLRENGRIVVMLAAFEGPPRIVRLHGTGRVVAAGDDGYDELVARFPSSPGLGARAVIVVDVTRVADTCGYGVPLMSFQDHRPALDAWARHKGPEGIHSYRAEHNARSLDGLDGLPRS